MGLSRGIIFVGALVLLTAILTVALAAMVYDGTPSDGDADAATGGLLGSAPASGSGIPGCTDPLIGTWQEVGGSDTYTFDGIYCYVNGDSTPYHYYGHQERVVTPAGALYTTTVYSCDGDPDEGFGFVDGQLRYIERGNNRWDVEWALTNTGFHDPVSGTFKIKGQDIWVTFGSYTVHVNERGYESTYTYHIVYDTVKQYTGRYQRDYGSQLIRVPDYYGYSWDGMDGFYYRNGKIYGCYYNDFKSNHDPFTFWIPDESEAWIFEKV